MRQSERLCYVCSKPVVRNGPTGRMPKFCSDTCRLAAVRAKRAAKNKAYWDALYDVQRRAFRAEVIGE